MLRLLFPYLLFGAIVLIVVTDRVGGGDPEQPAVGRDPVCSMDVGSTLAAEHAGERFFFCSARCRESFLEDPTAYASESCLVCRVDADQLVPVGETAPELTWQGTGYRFCGEAHRATFAHDPAGYFVHSMWGIPPWLYALSVGLVLVLSFGLFELIGLRARSSKLAPARLDLFRIPGLARLVRWPPFRFACQLAVAGVFVLIILAGLYGDQLASRNIAPLLTWTLWWGGLVVLIMFAGKAWCYVCPWDAIAGWVERIAFWRRRQGIGLGLAWPKSLRNIVLATVMFVGLTWLELGFGVTMNPRATALLALVMVSMAVVCALVFERRAFCRYACLVGRVSGLYALFSASEVRPADRGVCRSCSTKDCYHGNDRGDACPTGLFPGALTENTYCINCLECVKTCPEENMVVRARPWAADLAGSVHARSDEAYLALLMLAITGFHGLTMTRVWRDMLEWFEVHLGLGYVPAFSLGMLLLMAGPILVYAGLVRLSVLIARVREVSYGRAFKHFAYSCLPIALFYHLAHNLEHLLMEGQKIVALASNPFGFAPGQSWNVLGLAGHGPWNLLGTLDLHLPPLVSLPTLWLVQVLLVLIGHVFSLWIADRTARRLFPVQGVAFRSQIPMLVGMVLFSVFSLWLLKQPMEMRTSAM